MKLEVGKYYIQKVNILVGPIKHSTYSNIEEFPFEDENGNLYKEDGRAFAFTTNGLFDLIKEYSFVMIERIKEVIESEINPMLELHAGGCELLDVDDGIVTLRLFGGCSGCPSSQITLFNGIVPILKDRIDGILDVVLG